MKGKSSLVATGAVLLLTAFVLACSPEPVVEEKIVRVYNWSDYIDEEVLKEFEKETGIKVVYDTFDSNEILETKLLAGQTGYDVVVPSAGFMSRQIQAGVFRKLDKTKLPNLKHMWDVVQKRTEVYDPGGAHSVNYMWGTTGIGFNVEAIKQRMPDAPTDSWAMLFDPDVVAKFKDCGIHVLDAPAELVPAALRYLGEDPNSHDPAVIKKAEELLLKIRPNIQKFHSSEYINALANGDICLAVGWSGDVFQARDRAAEAKKGFSVEYVIPKEGALMWFDMMAIPKDAPHPENAHKFIDFMMRPEVIAKASNYVFYANGNKASQKLLEKDLLEDVAVYPSDEVLKKLYTTTAYPPKVQRTVTRAWTRVKTGQ